LKGSEMGRKGVLRAKCCLKEAGSGCQIVESALVLDG
jgi:hypothetical protein